MSHTRKNRNNHNKTKNQAVMQKNYLISDLILLNLIQYIRKLLQDLLKRY